uniref:ATP-dependent helicase n=1 Tax=Pithovirus LCPAC104 TaxID=2506589 RepID=A0A481Z4Y1_9VIRU|nr:MAG: ATP-dependent helicase [Pithovirus LCPAC104]
MIKMSLDSRNIFSKILPHLGDIIDKVRKNSIVTVIAPTGIGKSLGIPTAVARTGSKILVSVPTITAAISLSDTLSKILPQFKIGYAAEGEINYDKNTQIIYATSGHIRRKILGLFDSEKCKDWDFVEVLMIDEFHLRKIDNDIIQGLWNYCKNNNIKIPRLILSSATPDDYIKEKTTVYEIKDQGYPIHINYIKKIYNIGREEIYDDIIKLIINLNQTEEKPGHFLVFVPGSNDVDKIIHRIDNILDIIAIPAYSSLKIEEIKNIYQQVPIEKRKVVIATNIAETSITIPDITVVIDSMLEKRAETSASGGLRLITAKISKASAIQRCGRTGRTKKGKCFRMISEEEYSKLDEMVIPEINRIPIYEYIMEILNIGLEFNEIIPEISKERIIDSKILLKQLKLIENNKVTKIGEFVTKFPLGVRNSTLLWKWLEKKYPIFPVIAIISLIDSWGPSYFWFPKRKTEENFSKYNLRIKDFINENFKRFMGDSDLHVLINLWNSIMKESIGAVTNFNKIDIKDLSEWCKENNILFRKIKEVINIIKQINNILTRLGYKIEIAPFSLQGFIGRIKPLIEEIYSFTKMYHNSGNMYHHSNTKTNYSLERIKTLSYLTRNEPNEIIAFITAEIQVRDNKINVISLALNIDDKRKIIATPLDSNNIPKKVIKDKQTNEEKLREALILLKF